MQTQSNFRQHNCKPQLGGFVPAYWSAINMSLGYDRTSEITRVREGWDD
jgi:hypothetical protein